MFPNVPLPFVGHVQEVVLVLLVSAIGLLKGFESIDKPVLDLCQNGMQLLPEVDTF